MRTEINLQTCEILELKDAPSIELTIEDILAQKLNESKTYLISTDYYMTVDKYATLTSERQVELTTKRAEARELINTLEILLQGAI